MTNFELATNSFSHFKMCKEIGVLTEEDLRSDALWYEHWDFVADYMSENQSNSREMIGLIGAEKYSIWLQNNFDRVVHKLDKEFIYPHVDHLKILEKAKEGGYHSVKKVLEFYFLEIRRSNILSTGPEFSYILDNCADFFALSDDDDWAPAWERLVTNLLENPAALLKFAKQNYQLKHIAYLWKNGISEGLEEDTAKSVRVRALAHKLDMDEFVAALLHWAEYSKTQTVSIEYNTNEDIISSVNRFIEKLESFGKMEPVEYNQKALKTNEELIEYFSTDLRMTEEAGFELFNHYFNKNNDLLELATHLQRLNLDHFSSTEYREFASVYVDYVNSFKEVDTKVKVLAHFKLRTRFVRGFGVIDYMFNTYLSGGNVVEKVAGSVFEALDYLLDDIQGKMDPASSEFISLRSLFREVDAYFELRDVVEFIHKQINKFPQEKNLENNLLNLFTYFRIQNIQGVMSVRSWTVKAVLDLYKGSHCDSNSLDMLIEGFMPYANDQFKKTIGKSNAKIHDATQDTSLACLRSIVFERQIIMAYVLGKNSHMYPCQWIEVNQKAIDDAFELSMLIKGGFDAAKHVGNKYAMIYFGSKRTKKNLFKYSKKFETLVCVENKNGVPGLEYANPFEKGFSWGQYEEFCKHLETVTYATTVSQRKKRMCAQFFANMFADSPTCIERKLKAELGAEMSLQKVAALVSRQITALGDDDFGLDYKPSNIQENREAINQFWKTNLKEIGQCAFFMQFVGVTGKLPKAGMLKNLSSMVKNLGRQQAADMLLTFSEQSEYCALAHQNTVSLDVIVATLQYAKEVKAPLPKEIALNEVSDSDSGLTGRMLDAGDMRALSIGDEINCCQYLTGHAQTCAKATYTESDFGVFVVESTAKRGSKPLAESAVWLSDNKNVVVIDSIEGQRKDAASYEKIANVYYKAILQWIAQGKMVVLSNTDYGLTVQVRRKIFAKLKNNPKYERSPKMRSMSHSVYSDLGSYAYYITDKDI